MMSALVYNQVELKLSLQTDDNDDGGDTVKLIVIKTNYNYDTLQRMNGWLLELETTKNRLGNHLSVYQLHNDNTMITQR